MKYNRNQYSEGVSICSFIIAGMFLYWGLNDVWFRPFIEGGAYSWFGWIWIAIGLSILVGQIVNWTNKSKLRNLVLFEYEQRPNASIEEVSRSTGVSIRDVQAIVLDLKASGLLRGKFSSTTGEMKNVEVVKSTEGLKPETGVKYCPNCGTAKSKEAAVFCSYCGSKF